MKQQHVLISAILYSTQIECGFPISPAARIDASVHRAQATVPAVLSSRCLGAGDALELRAPSKLESYGYGCYCSAGSSAIAVTVAVVVWNKLSHFDGALEAEESCCSVWIRWESVVKTDSEHEILLRVVVVRTKRTWIAIGVAADSPS